MSGRVSGGRRKIILGPQHVIRNHCQPTYRSFFLSLSALKITEIMGGWMAEWMDGWMDGQTDKWTDVQKEWESRWAGG